MLYSNHSYFWNTKSNEVSWYPPKGSKYPNQTSHVIDFDLKCVCLILIAQILNAPEVKERFEEVRTRLPYFCSIEITLFLLTQPEEHQQQSIDDSISKASKEKKRPAPYRKPERSGRPGSENFAFAVQNTLQSFTPTSTGYKGQDDGELDPMDPASYSDVPRYI